MGKLKTYLRYLYEYLKYGDVGSVVASFNYLLWKKSHSHDRIVHSGIGKIYCRAHTNDFQFANYKYEWTVKKFMLERFPDYDIFIDVGACIGEYSILAAKRGLKCFAFEPVSSNYRTMVANLKLNEFKEEIRAFPFGLGDITKQVNFAINPVNTGASHLAKADEAPLLDEVRILPLDSLLDQMDLKYTDRFLVKLDVEGMEADVIKGAAEFIMKYPNMLFVIEIKHSDRKRVIDLLNAGGVFETGDVDDYNIYARKKANVQT